MNVPSFAALAAEQGAAFFRQIQTQAEPVMTTQAHGTLEARSVNFLLGKLRERDRLAFHRIINGGLLADRRATGAAFLGRPAPVAPARTS